MIDISKSYKVEQRPISNDSSLLDKHGLSRHVGTQKGFSVGFNSISRRYKTGLDEFAPEVLTLPTKEKEAKIEWIKATKTALEERSGRNLDPTEKNADFWDLWVVWIEITQDKKVRVMGSHPQFQPNQHWEHQLALITLDANDSLPRNRAQASEPQYKNAQFMLTTAEEEEKIVESSLKRNRQRNVEMNKLFGEGGAGFERAFNIAYLLGFQKESNIGINALENVLEAMTPQPEYIERFIELCSKENDELSVSVTIKKAIDYDIIKFKPEAKLHYRGGMNFRESGQDTVKFFLTNIAEPTIAREYSEILELVRKRDSKQKKV